VREYFKTARLHAEAVLQQKNLMEVVMWIAVVFVSQSDVNVSLGEDGLDLVLVSPIIFDQLRLNKTGMAKT
jgi:hypothetical protein